MATAFNTQGAVPKIPSIGPLFPSLLGASSPYGKALASSSQAPNMSTNQGPKYAPPPVLQPPSTPVKKQTVNNADGSSHVVEYHAPEKATSGLLTSSQPAAAQTTAGDHAVIPTVPTGTPQPQVQTPYVNTQSTDTSSTATQPNTGTTNDPTTFPGIIGGAVSAAQGNAPIGQDAADIAKKYGEQIAQTGVLAAGGQAGDLSTGTSVVGEGNANLVANAASQRAASLVAGEDAALKGTGQQLTAQNQEAGALNTAAGTVAPTLGGYNQQPFNPLTNSFGGSGAQGSLPPQAQDFVNSLAKQVQNGSMTRSDAEGRLTAYGQPGLQALDSALGPNFNTNASNASAGTTATGQQLQTQATAANQALDTLQQQFSQLGNLTGATGFQPLNSVEQSISNLFGNNAVSQYTTTLQEARAKISGVLAASGGVTPTTADEMAKTYLPDGMTPSQLPAKIAAAKTLIQQSVDAFTKSGQQNSNTNSNAQSNSLYSF